jgi:hypothetical protein
MDLLFQYQQVKNDRKQNSFSKCDLKLWNDGKTIQYYGQFEFDYNRYESKKHVSFIHSLTINTENGDIDVTYKIINDNLTDLKFFRNTYKNKKNDFKMLLDLTDNGFFRGEKRIGYWGIKYTRANVSILRLILDNLKDKFKSEYLYDKLSNEKCVINTLYDMVVDFHLDMKGIKGHDNVYNDIQNDYPKKKYLLKNDNKFLPAVLDYYGIKSKYLVGELNKNLGKPIQLGTLNYICKLFGKNYIDYLKQISWETHCYETPPNKKVHELKNESEKNCMVGVINKWETDTLKSDSCVYSVNKLLSIRDLMEPRNVTLKFKARNDNDFDNTMEIWSGIKLHFARGYKVKYDISQSFIDEIEKEIVINGETYKPRILLSEEDFRTEGYNMKNCMAKQFPHGAIYIFTSLQCKRKKINLQYRKGKLIQAYGKANTSVNNEIFDEAVKILTSRFELHPNIEWKKEKFDFLTN